MSTSMDQERAAAAWALVSEVPADEFAEFRSRAMSLPAMLQASGLIATVAFLGSKATAGSSLGRAYQRTLTSVVRWSLSQAGVRQLAAENAGMGEVASLSPRDYAVAQREAQLFAGWLRRGVEARKAVMEAAGEPADA